MPIKAEREGEMQLSGSFVNGERYKDSFRNKKEFGWVLAHIAQNGACCYPDRIYGDKAEDKLPNGKLTVKNPGGDLKVTVSGKEGAVTELLLEGPTEIVKILEV